MAYGCFFLIALRSQMSRFKIYDISFCETANANQVQDGLSELVLKS